MNSLYGEAGEQTHPYFVGDGLGDFDTCSNCLMHKQPRPVNLNGNDLATCSCGSGGISGNAEEVSFNIFTKTFLQCLLY